MKLLSLLATLGLAACGRPAEFSSAVPPAAQRNVRGPLSADEHERAAEYHKTEAQAARDAAETAKSDEDAMGPVQCFDQPVDEQASSGGEGYQPPRKCWSPQDKPSAKLTRQAEWHEQEAASHRRQARQLRDDERAACKTLSATDPNPFASPETIASVQAHKENGELRGARVTFRTGGGRTARLVESRLACHLARLATQGYPDDGKDPTAVPGVETLVSGDTQEIAVVVRVPEEFAQQVLTRAQALQP